MQIGFQDFNSVVILKILFFFCFCSNKYYIGWISNISYWFVIRFYFSYIPVMLAVSGLLEYSQANRISGFQQCSYFENSIFFGFCSNKYYIGWISNISYWFVIRFYFSYIPVMLAVGGLLEYSHANRISGFQQYSYFKNSIFFGFCSNKYFIG